MNTTPSADIPKRTMSPSSRIGIWQSLMVICGLFFALAAGYSSFRMMSPPKSVSVTQLSAAARGTVLNVIVEVNSVSSSGDIQANLLDKREEGYLRTSTAVEIRLSSDVKLVMGERDNLRPGAILQVHGTANVTGGKRLDANEIVFLTHYVKVKK